MSTTIERTNLIAEQQSMNSSERDNESHFMLPPSRIFIQGSEEYQAALESGALELSLPSNSYIPPPRTPSATSNLANVGNRTPPRRSLTPVVSPLERTFDDASMNSSCEGELLDSTSDGAGYTTNTNTNHLVSSPHSTMNGFDSISISDDNDNVDMVVDRDTASLHHTPEEHTSLSRDRVRTSRNHLEQTRFADIIGHASAKLHMEELLLPLALPPEVAASIFTGARAMPASVLMYGPPGCGKTQLARAMAGEASAAFIQVAPSNILSKFVGESETAVRDIFKKATERALLLDSKCAVVFFDEIDALGQSREDRGSGEGEGCSRRVLAELLMVMSEITDRKYRAPVDDFETGKDDDASIDTIQGTVEQARIIVVAATNRIHDLDPALKRRFGVQLPIDPPGTRERKEMLLRQLDGIDYAISNDTLNYFSGWLEGWTGSGLSSLVREAAMTPVRECLRKAAKMRKRPTRPNVQCGGDTSGQEDSAGPTDPDLDAKTYLLSAIKTLRPVSDQDFVLAIHFLQPDTAPTCSPLAVHYDSSSDEDI